MSRLIDLQRRAWQIAEDKGFHENRSASRDDTTVRLCLVHTEISEAVQEVKRHWVGNGTRPIIDKVGEELADAVIRILDLCEIIGVNLESAVSDKMNKNTLRERNYGTPSAEKGAA